MFDQSSVVKKMVAGIEKLAEKMKIRTKEHFDDAHQEGGHHEKGGSHEPHEGGGHEHHGGHVTACPVLVERPGASQKSKLDGKPFRVTIVASHWYEKVVHSLVDECSKELLAKGVLEDHLHVVEVAGAFTLPFTAARLIASKNMSHRPDAIICIGCFVEDTTHTCETIRQAVAYGIMKLNVTSDVPVIFGVLCCDTASQAHSSVEKRPCYGIDNTVTCNFGVSWAQSALQMAHLNRCSSVKAIERCSCFRSENRSSGAEHKHKPMKYESGSEPSGEHEMKKGLPDAKEERASSGGDGVHVSASKCDRCGNPSGGCECGLLH